MAKLGTLDGGTMLTWRHFSLLFLLSCAFEVSLEGEEDGPPRVGFEFAMSGADELSGTITVPIVLSRTSDIPISITYSLLNANTATPGSDFDVITGTIVFQPGEERREVPVTIKNDTDETEAVETFDIALSAPVGATLDAMKAIHKVVIADHILPRVTVGPATTMTGEGVPSQLVVTLDKPSEGQSTVVIGVNGGMTNPASAADYTIIDNSQVTIPNGATSVNVPIGERDDTLDEEDNETVVFTIRGASPNLVIGMNKALTHSITDNDLMPQVRFNTPNQSIQENQIGTNPTVTLSAASGRTVRVDFVRDANDTCDGNDATVFGSPGTITFNPGDTSEPLSLIGIGIDNDAIDEDNETVVVNLSNPTNAVITNGILTLTVQDNDTAQARWATSGNTVTEGTTVNINITLDIVSTKTVTVPFSINGGSTDAESDDYTIMTASPLTFAPGVQSQTITIDVPANSPGNESQDHLALDIGTVTNAVRGSPSRYTLTINE